MAVGTVGLAVELQHGGGFGRIAVIHRLRHYHHAIVGIAAEHFPAKNLVRGIKRAEIATTVHHYRDIGFQRRERAGEMAADLMHAHAERVQHVGRALPYQKIADIVVVREIPEHRIPAD